MRAVWHIFQLGLKELLSLARDPVLLFLIGYVLHLLGLHAGEERGDGRDQRLDRHRQRGRLQGLATDPATPCCRRCSCPPKRSASATSTTPWTAGKYTFVVDIPPNFEADIDRRQPAHGVRS
jgi:ABC-2 type transport system permease protein